MTQRNLNGKRSRQSLHFADRTASDLGEAYLKAEHDVYPRKLNKANFIEALIVVGLQHIDEVIKLALVQQEEEDEK